MISLWWKSRALLVCCWLFVVFRRVSAPVCEDEMGMRNGNISDDQIVFSSTYDVSAEPSSARLGAMQAVEQPGAWVAGDLDDRQFLEIDFSEPRTITGIMTQGRDLVPQWVTAFSVSYSQDKKTWDYVADKDRNIKIFPGNFDSDTPVTTFFQQPLRTRYLRVNPVRWNNWIAMRLEIIGCFEPYAETTHPESVLPYTATTSLPPFMRGVCEEPMGLENHLLPDAFIMASSTAFVWSGPTRLRLNQQTDDRGTGGWVPAKSDLMPYVLVDFHSPRNLTGIITQGREEAKMWSLSYTVQYSMDNLTWYYCHDLIKNDVIFPGNKDSNTPDIRLFREMVEARFIKVTVKSYYNRPALRMELLGCYKPYDVTTPAPEATTTERCITYGPWLSISDSVMHGDKEPIDKLIDYSRLCANPMVIECREIVTKKSHTKVGQKVECDLSNGLLCRNSDQHNGRCLNYEARIGCWNCETTASPTSFAPLTVCPEIPYELIDHCPMTCQANYSCDGRSCIPHVHCPCFQDGKRFKAGDIHINYNCDRCECMIGGHSKCQPLKCPSCGEGQKPQINQLCQCECKSCEFGTVLCPTNGQCIDETLWCDKTVDCPDDEVFCPTYPPITEPVEVTTSSASLIRSCNLDVDSDVDTCEMNMNTFTTFDGSVYQYDVCDHMLMKEEINERFFVTVHYQCSDSISSRCRRHVMVYVDDMELQLGPDDDQVVFNGYEVPPQNFWLLTNRFQDMDLKKRGNQIVFRSHKYNFEVRWDPRQDVKIRVSKCSRNAIVGLCGFYNGNPSDDLMKPEGKLASSSVEFGNSWTIGDLANCQIPVCSSDISSSNKLIAAAEVCSSFHQQPFNDCSTYLDIATRTDVCLSFVCECLGQKFTSADLEKCKCEAYEAYITECEDISKSVFGSEWRLKYNCAPDCPPGLEWQDCGPGCDLTCDNYHNREKICEDQCVPGCYCPPGSIHHNGHCVKQEMCQDCVCKGHGDPNYITFDNQYYAFQGNCTYVLAQQQHSKKHGLEFQVLGVNFECPEEPHTSCTSGIKVLWRGHVIEKFQYEPVVVDGVPYNVNVTTFEKDGISITYVPRKSTIIHIAEINLSVRYFDQMYAFSIELPAYLYFNKTEGLCGVCNFDKSDDLLHKDGYVTEDIDDFAYSWLVGSSKDECTLPRVEAKNPLPGICNFTSNSCALFLDPTLYSKACENDVMYSHKPTATVCRSKFQYAQQCCEKGISLKEWLEASGCISSCPENMIFECTAACQKTCENHEDSIMCHLMPLYTCTCPPGEVLKNGVCVETSACNEPDNVCIYEHKVEVRNGVEIPLLEENFHYKSYGLGSNWTDGLCRQCSCIEKGGRLVANCYVEHCIGKHELPDTDTYVYEEIFEYGNCCPKHKRVKCVSGGKAYRVNEEWPSSDGDKCKSYSCILLPTGEVTVLQRNTVCDINCPAYAVYEPPSTDSPNCCGRCKPVACEENGIVYPARTKWRSSTKACFTAECSVSDNMTSITYTGKSCLAVRSDCPKEYASLTEDGCCKTCNLPADSCLPVLVPEEETVNFFALSDAVHGECRNEKPLFNLTRCSGQCNPSSYAHYGNFENTCSCCLPSSAKNRRIQLSCTDGTEMTKLYHEPQACQCMSCGGTIEVPPAN